MIVNIRESKARLSELVEKAAAGEEIMITVRGRPRARILAAGPETPRMNFRAWAEERRKALGRRPSRAGGDSSAAILNELRGDRV
jgi:prevent-host-death family protein